jgi:branched-chain amino acid transport system ATP-binding protein
MLKLDAVAAGYGTFQALFGTTLDVNAGEAVGVIGPNGAGKTTLMRVISGMIRPWSGAIGMEGVDVLAEAPHRIIELGIAHVPENRRLFPRLTVEGNLRMGAFTRRRGRSSRPAGVRVRPLPEDEGRRNQLAGTLSGGEQQMCAIGRALMSDPAAVAGRALGGPRRWSCNRCSSWSGGSARAVSPC